MGKVERGNQSVMIEERMTTNVCYSKEVKKKKQAEKDV